MRLEDVFQDSAARILDALAGAVNMTATVPLLASAAKVDIRTARRAVDRLIRLHVLAVDARLGIGVVTFADGQAAQAVLTFYRALEKVSQGAIG
jgi:DNA-binding IclR family transcriptional regulator